jgi:hypothetical protein
MGKKSLSVRRVLGGERGHTDRLWILHLLEDRIEVVVHERSQRDVHPATVMRQLHGSKVSALTTSRDSGDGWSCVE